MKGYWFLVLFFLGISVVAYPFEQRCEQDKEHWEKIKARKVAFLSEKMNLTVAESQAFWPLYNEYIEKKDKLLVELYPKLSKEEIDNLMNLSDKEAAEKMDNYFDKQKQFHALEKEYNQKFRKILPEHKVLRMYMAELLFRKELLENLRDSRLTKNNQASTPKKP